MQQFQPVPTGGSDRIHAETRTRDAGYVMKGHHCHTCHELFYVESGSCRFLIEDNIYDLQAGDFILIPPMALHYTRYVCGSCRRTVVLFLLENVEEEVRRLMPKGEAFFQEMQIFQVPSGFRSQIGGYLRQLVAEERIQDAQSEALRRLLLGSLLLICGRNCAFFSEPPVEIHTTDQQILKAARYISEHYMSPVTTADVANAVGFSPNYLSKKFRQSAGIGLHEYLVFVRLHHAAQELVSTDDSITAIALRCGFSDSNYFKDSFKKKYGITPREYRRIG